MTRLKILGRPGHPAAFVTVLKTVRGHCCMNHKVDQLLPCFVLIIKFRDSAEVNATVCRKHLRATLTKSTGGIGNVQVYGGPFDGVKIVHPQLDDLIEILTAESA